VSLHISLEEGFERDSVVATINGREVYRSGELTTRTPIGFAAAFEANVNSVPASLRIDVPSRGIDATHDLLNERKNYVGVSVVRGRIEFRESDDQFRYA
jgi:hypothetical protein